MNRQTIALLATLTFCSATQAGEILRCVGASGEVMYTNLACPSNSQAHHVSNYESVPDAPAPSYAHAAEEAAISARLAQEAAERAEAAAYAHAANYYDDSYPSDRGGPYHQYEDNNLYYPAYFGGSPLLGAGFPNHRHGAHHTTGKDGHGGGNRPTHPIQPVRPIQTAGGMRR